jgi:chromosome segregation ATPase
MGSLKEMIGFLDDTRKIMESILDKLGKLQEHFNRNYNNVIAVRNSEIQFLQKEFFTRPESFPAEIRELYSRNLKTQEKIFSENLSAIIKKRDELKSNIDQINKDRIDFSEKLKKSNTTLDAKEEALKKKVEELEAKTSAYNKTIDELNTGFGFITNFFKMKKIEEEKEAILLKRDELVGQVETIRNKWVEAEKTIGEQDLKIQENWNYLQTEYSITSEKIETLEKNKDELIKKGAFSEALAELQGSEKYLSARSGARAPEKCRKCGSANSTNLFFCDFCGEPFAENRGDIEGSLVETGELNRIYTALTEGVKEAVSNIALMRGIRDGVNTFTESIKKVKSTEDTYSQLPKLKIDVPKFTAEMSEKISEIEKGIDVKFFNLHPLDFAMKIKADTEKTLTKDSIEKFFTLMGDELNKTTKAQW